MEITTAEYVDNYDYYDDNETAQCDFSEWEPSYSLIPVLYMLIFILGLSVNDQNSNRTTCAMDFSLVTMNQRHEYLWIAGLSLSSSALGFLLPFLAMTIFYCFIGCTVTRHFNNLRKEDQKKKRLLKIITTLVVVFAICWTPFHVLKSMDALSYLNLAPNFCGFLRFLLLAHPYATCLAYVNSCLNPFLYAFFDLRFRSQCLCLLNLKKAMHGQMSSMSSTLSAQTQKSEIQSLATKQNAADLTAAELEADHRMVPVMDVRPLIKRTFGCPSLCLFVLPVNLEHKRVYWRKPRKEDFEVERVLKACLEAQDSCACFRAKCISYHWLVPVPVQLLEALSLRSRIDPESVLSESLQKKPPAGDKAGDDSSDRPCPLPTAITQRPITAINRDSRKLCLLTVARRRTTSRQDQIQRLYRHREEGG
ncbi:hypothetical protein FQN60_018279 [Etheostoma spectabile]|uniref:G-protein coupled receptors family 1 profile domain-containing protein n=1 Tax=Etheostoma spectabile TaxID=54343 RepID=A0A5J5DHH8_9PERO|nr:hypothetical protein FQN60_018279 [Etheostoma spectabile]